MFSSGGSTDSLFPLGDHKINLCDSAAFPSVSFMAFVRANRSSVLRLVHVIICEDTAALLHPRFPGTLFLF